MIKLWKKQLDCRSQEEQVIQCKLCVNDMQVEISSKEVKYKIGKEGQYKGKNKYLYAQGEIKRSLYSGSRTDQL